MSEKIQDTVLENAECENEAVATEEKSAKKKSEKDSKSDAKKLKSELDELKKTLSEKENIDLLTYVLSLAKEQNVPVILWDTYWDSADYDGDLGLYHLGKNEWQSQELLNAIMDTVISN